MATFYVLSYLAFCVPALAAGLMVRQFGLVATSEVYALVLVGLCAVAGVLNLPAMRGARSI